jgi:hypothetical protein
MAGAGSPTGVPRSGSPPPQGQGCRQSSPFPRREASGESDWAFSWPGQTSVDAACQPKWQTASHHDYPLLTVAMWPTVHRAAVSKNAASVSNRCSIVFLGGDLARPGAGPADRGAAGAVRGAARRRPGTLCEAPANVQPYLRADGTRIWSLMQLERQLRPEAYRRRRGGYLDRRRTRQ